MFRKISVIGAGSWGTALAVLLAEHRGSVRLWAHQPARAEELLHQRCNSTYLPNVRIPPNVYATSDLAEAANADLILMVTPSKAIREVAENLAAAGLKSDTIVVTCTKGIEHGSGKLMSEVLEDCLPGNPVAVLSGPNHAVEIAQRIPAAGVIGSNDKIVLQDLQKAFVVSNYRAYSSSDIRGIQLGGALKNIFAIAAGCSDGFGMGDNAKAGLVTRSLAEMTRLGVAMGGCRETFQGLSGIGDLMVTCFSRHSRNRSFGERMGRGEKCSDIQESMQMVAEGVPTARSAYECARRLGVDTPIIDQVYAVLYENKPPHEAMWGLLGRAPRPEQDASQP